MSIVNQLMAAVIAVLIGLVSGTVYLMSDSSKATLCLHVRFHPLTSSTHITLLFIKLTNASGAVL